MLIINTLTCYRLTDTIDKPMYIEFRFDHPFLSLIIGSLLHTIKLMKPCCKKIDFNDKPINIS